MSRRRGNKDKTDIIHRLADAALVAGKTAADALAKRPSVQASLDSLEMRIATGKADKHETIDLVYKNADNIIDLLDLKGFYSSMEENTERTN